MWRMCVAFVFGAVLALGSTALSSPDVDLTRARLAQEPSQESTADEADSSSTTDAPSEDDRPLPEDTEGVARMVGSPTEVGVEVLGNTDSSESSDGVDGDAAADVGQTEPASQVEATPNFTG